MKYLQGDNISTHLIPNKILIPLPSAHITYVLPFLVMAPLPVNQRLLLSPFSGRLQTHDPPTGFLCYLFIDVFFFNLQLRHF